MSFKLWWKILKDAENGKYISRSVVKNAEMWFEVMY